MKNKKSQKAEIKEINVDDLVMVLKKKERDEPTPAKPVSHKLKKADDKRPDEASKPIGNSADTKEKIPNESQNAAVPVSDASQPSESVMGNGQMSRSKKQRLRLLRKLQLRQADQGPGGDNESISNGSVGELSDDEASRGTDPRGPRTPRPKGKRNYVERTSQSALAAPPPGSCGWKDAACIFFVLLLVGIAGFLKFQEEVFGSMDHLRSEADADADFYEILGVAHSATARDVKRAYRTKVMAVHPDRHPECSDCAQKFMATTRAYETLIDDEKRRIYDQTRGSYEPILSDYSVSLTYFNYHKLVTESPSVWVIEVYDDLDPSSKHFASTWDVVAGSKLASELVKFGRVNARRDRAVLSLLPIRARQYPTVIMFSKDTLPSIFSLADMSGSALTAWIQKNVPSHVNEHMNNRYKLVLAAKSSEPAFMIKTASVHFARVFDFDYNPVRSGKNGVMMSVSDTVTGKTLLPSQVLQYDAIPSFLNALKERLVVPVNRENLADVCSPDISDNSVYCEFVSSVEAPYNKARVIDGGIVVQRVYAPQAGHGYVLDFQGSRIDSSPIDLEVFINEKFPESFFGLLKRNRNTLVVAISMVAVFLAVTRVGALQITIAVASLSIVVGLLSSPLAKAFFEWFNAKLR